MNRRGDFVDVLIVAIVLGAIVIAALDIDIGLLGQRINDELNSSKKHVCPEPIVCPEQKIYTPVEQVVEVEAYEPVEAPTINIDDSSGTGY